MDFQTAPAIAAAVAESAMATGVARKQVDPKDSCGRKPSTTCTKGSSPSRPNPCSPATLAEESVELHHRYCGIVGVKVKIPVKDHHILRMLYLPPAAAEAPKIITENPLEAFELTCKSNLVAVVTDGSAVLGLGNIGARASLPGYGRKMRSVSNVRPASKRIPIAVNTQDDEEFIATVKAIAPSFGAINLEDIASPRCFGIEKGPVRSFGYPGLSRRPARDRRGRPGRTDQRAQGRGKGDGRHPDRYQRGRGRGRRRRAHA